MKAIVQHAYGSAGDAMSLREINKPTPKDDEVLLRVHAAGVNWADWSLTAGRPYVMRLIYGFRKPRQGSLGSDVAGTVEAVGNTVTNLQVGDEVFGAAKGSFAEYATAKAKQVAPKPAGLSFEHAAAIPMAGLVALQALRDVGKISAGQKVLVNGASGGIGSFTVQIAKEMGAEVTGVASTANLDMLRAIGADHVIDYTQDDFTQGTEKYDLILDMADKHSIAERRGVLTANGTLIPNSGVGGAWFGSVGRIVRAKLLSPFIKHNLKPFLSLPKQEDLVTLGELAEAGTITATIDRAVPLADTATAIAYVGAGHAKGKTVITVD
ncbi:MAG: NAD(P)-dependent alcohol dehydrogenase [bacterium]|nr:NAD(P)-dependent alcohol dehydrogenase [bacterium]